MVDSHRAGAFPIFESRHTMTSFPALLPWNSLFKPILGVGAPNPQIRLVSNPLRPRCSLAYRSADSAIQRLGILLSSILSHFLTPDPRWKQTLIIVSTGPRTPAATAPSKAAGTTESVAEVMVHRRLPETEVEPKCVYNDSMHHLRIWLWYRYLVSVISAYILGVACSMICAAQSMNRTSMSRQYLTLLILTHAHSSIIGPTNLIQLLPHPSSPSSIIHISKQTPKQVCLDDLAIYSILIHVDRRYKL